MINYMEIRIKKGYLNSRIVKEDDVVYPHSMLYLINKDMVSSNDTVLKLATENHIGRIHIKKDDFANNEDINNSNILFDFLVSNNYEVTSDIRKVNSVDDDVISGMEEDAKKILTKLNKAIDDNKESNYKVLINNLRETMELRNATQNKSNKVINIGNMNVPNLNYQEFADQLNKVMTLDSNSADFYDFKSDNKNIEKYAETGHIINGFAICRIDKYFDSIKKADYLINIYPQKSCTWGIEKNDGYFIVKADKDTDFTWEIIKNDEVKDNNYKLQQKLEKPIDSIFKIKMGEKCFPVLQQALELFLKEDYEIEQEHSSDVLSLDCHACMPKTLRFSNDSTVKEILNTILTFCPGRFGKIKNGKLIIYYKDKFITEE